MATVLLVSGSYIHSQAQVQHSPESSAEPTNAAGWLARGNLLIRSNQYEPAITAYSKALAIQPDYEAALLNRAIAQLRADLLDGAKKDYEDFLRRFSSTNAAAYYGLGEIAYRRKQWSAAQKNYEQYLRYVPTNHQNEVVLVQRRLKEIRALNP